MNADRVAAVIGTFSALCLIFGYALHMKIAQGRHRAMCERALATATASDSLALYREPYRCDVVGR